MAAPTKTPLFPLPAASASRAARRAATTTGRSSGSTPSSFISSSDLLDGLLLDEAQGVLAGVAEVAPDELLLGRLAHDGVVGDAEARGVAAHVGRRLVERRPAGDLLDDPLEDREDLDVPVVVDGDLAVGLEVEGIDQVEVADVGRGRLVGDVDRVLERQVPDGEGLELGVARGEAAPVFVVELGQAGGQLAAARARPGDDDERVLGLDVVVGPVALVADDDVDVGRDSPW